MNWIILEHKNKVSDHDVKTLVTEVGRPSHDPSGRPSKPQVQDLVDWARKILKTYGSVEPWI